MSSSENSAPPSISEAESSQSTDSRLNLLRRNHVKGEAKTTLGYGNFDQELSRGDLAKMIIIHEYPLNIVEHFGFRMYSRNLQPLFKMPSRDTIRSDILTIYEFEKTEVMNILEANESRISITTDMWTASNQKKRYMAVTAHFLDASWKLQKRMISFRYVPAPHTAEVVTDHLIDTLLTWNIDQNLATLTVDNASYNDNVAAEVVERFGESSFMASGSLFHMRCCAHVMNLIVQDGLNVIKSAIEKVRLSVIFWTATPKRVEIFDETCRAMKVSVSKRLELDCPTIWDSTYLMLESALRCRTIFFRLKVRDSDYQVFPSDEEWDMTKKVCSMLKIFYEVTKIFSRSNYPIANHFIYVCQIRLAINGWLTSQDELTKTMALKMDEKFQKYWDATHCLLALASILDPRYKLELLEFCFEKIYGDSREQELEKVKYTMSQLFQEYQDKFEKEKQSNSMDSETVGSETADSSSSNLAQFDQYVSRKRKRKANVRSELDHYLEDDVLPRIVNFDILAWWKTNGLQYPVLQMMARDILALPVSTVASESCFSTGGRLLSPQRDRLFPTTVEALACAYDWLLKDLNKDECEPYQLDSIHQDDEGNIDFSDGKSFISQI